MDAKTLREYLHYDPDTGVFTWFKKSGKKPVVGAVAGTQDAFGYWRIRLFGVSYLSHRLAWLYMTGEWPAAEIDHIDGCPANNSWSNLRPATSQQNKQNRRRRVGASGFRGVTWLEPNKKWRASITHNRQHIYIGLFKTAEEAYAAYCKRASELHTHSPHSTENHNECNG